jgi:hypothetical protein
MFSQPTNDQKRAKRCRELKKCHKSSRIRETLPTIDKWTFFFHPV